MRINFKIALVLKPLVENVKVEFPPLLPYLNEFVSIRKFKTVEKLFFTQPLEGLGEIGQIGYLEINQKCKKSTKKKKIETASYPPPWRG